MDDVESDSFVVLFVPTHCWKIISDQIQFNRIVEILTKTFRAWTVLTSIQR